MATLEQLMTLPGAMAAFAFRGSGELLDQKIAYPDRIDDSILDMLAHMCAANMSIASMQARGWENMTGMTGFYPVREFTLVGFDWSVVVSGVHRQSQQANTNEVLPPFLGVVMANDKADYEAALAALEA